MSDAEPHVPDPESCEGGKPLPAERILERLLLLSSRVATESSVPAILQAIVDTAAELSSAQMGTLQLFDDSSRFLHMAAHVGFQKPFLDFFAVAPADDSPCFEAVRRHERIIVEDVENSPILRGTAAMALLLEAGVHACQTTLLESRPGKLLGIMSTYWTVPHRPDESTLKLLDLLAHEAANTIERRQREEAREREDNLLSMVARATDVQLVYLDPDFNFIWVNDAYAATCKTTREEMIGKNHFDLYPGEDVEAIFRHVRDTGEPVFFKDRPFEFPDQPERGVTYWDWSLVPVVSSTGQLSGLVFSLRETTPYKRAQLALAEREKRLRESEERESRHAASLQAVLDTTPAVIWIAHDRECRQITGNRAAYASLGMPQGENLSKTSENPENVAHIRVFHAGVELAPHDMPIQQVAASGRALLDYEIDHVFDDGTVCNLIGNVTPLFNEEGEPAGAVAAFRDITARKEAETALRQSEARLRSVFDNLLDGYAFCQLLYDERGHAIDCLILEVNKSFGMLTGLDNVSGRTVTELVPGILQSNPELFQTFERVEAMQRPERFEIYIAPIGHWFNVSVYSPKKDHVVVLFDNVTDRKTSESEREKLLETLREADRQKNNFIAVLSHELRNPLAPINNSVFVLEHVTVGGNQARQALEVINRQVAYMTRLIDDLLDITRITQGKIRLKRERVNLRDIVQRTLEDQLQVIGKSGVHLEVLPLPNEAWVNGDRTRLSQIITNLLQNAVKFTPAEGKITVVLETDDSCGEAMIVVRDTGTGMVPEMIPRLFQPFTQADTTLDRSKGGLGLGLALVKELVEMHGGSVRAQSEGPGKGSTFTLRIPLDPGDMQTPQHDLQSSNTRHDGRRVLIIEDNTDAAEMLSMSLNIFGHSVEWARNGPEGLQKAAAFKPDIVLCDIGLPIMDGYQIARAMRADPKLSPLPLIALSGYAQPDDVENAIHSGFNAHLGKPVNVEKLQELIVSLTAAGR